MSALYVLFIKTLTLTGTFARTPPVAPTLRRVWTILSLVLPIILQTGAFLYRVTAPERQQLYEIELVRHASRSD